MLIIQKTSVWCPGPLENVLGAFNSGCGSTGLTENHHSQWNCFDVFTNRKQISFLKTMIFRFILRRPVGKYLFKVVISNIISTKSTYTF